MGRAIGRLLNSLLFASSQTSVSHGKLSSNGRIYTGKRGPLFVGGVTGGCCVRVVSTNACNEAMYLERYCISVIAL